ncbi:hypothetical protein HQ545_00860 [Candidatus Woesearchaeota archaeon]|nr:hypothetical protein [Candidatus Woesearchaeota archaeon]
MKKNYVNSLVFLGILIITLSIIGCQGYQPPTYKAPEDAVEDVEIDVTDLGDDEFDNDDWWEEVDEGLDEAEDVDGAGEADEAGEAGEAEEADEPVVKSFKPTSRTAPVEDEEVVVDEAEEDDEESFTRSPYRPIVEEDLPTLIVTEGELVNIAVKATDADGDELTYTFTQPLDEDGEWQTRVGDQGVYYPEITVSDGKEEVINKVKLIVEPKNNKPVLAFIADINVEEGDTVVLTPKSTDGDGDRITYSYSGWMSSSTKTTDYGDSGTHKVVVSATDGISTVTQEVTVTVEDVNRVPEVEIEF